MNVPYLIEAASAHARDLDAVLASIHVHMLLLFIGWSALFFYSIWRFRRRRHPEADYRGMRATLPAIAVGLVIVGDVLVLATSALPAWLDRVRTPTGPGVFEVRVIAEQFAWNVHYPGPDGRFGRTDPTLLGPSNPLGIDRADPDARDDVGLLNVLMVPVNRPVLVHLSSRDVVHSFTLPQMRVKQDAVPGLPSRTWFTATRLGKWEIVCSQLCGLGHYRMKGEYAVLTADAWEAWMSGEQALIGGAAGPR